MALKTFTTADGSANQALVTNGSGVLSFAAVGASAGQVIQVVGATDQTQRSTTSTSFVTGSNTLSVTITPSATANKIYISVSTTIQNNTGEEVYLTLYRDATNLGNGNAGLTYLYGGAAAGVLATGSFVYLDSPSTTSATTYQVYLRSNSASYTANMNYGGSKAAIVAMEVKG